MARLILLPKHNHGVAMPRGHGDVQRAEERSRLILARGYDGQAIGSGREVLVPADIERMQAGRGWPGA